MPESTPTTHHTKAVLFDMDGTLIDSSPAIARAWTTWAMRWNIGDVFTEHDHGRPARQIVADHVPADRVDEAFRDIEQLEVDDTDGLEALPGVLALLAALPADRWAIVTSCSGPLAEARVAAVGLNPAVLVTASDTERGKPHPDPYLLGAARLGVAPEDCIVVEDAPTGLTAGRAAGSATLGVHGTVPPALLQADYVVASLEHVTAAVTADGIELTIREP